MLKYLDGIHTLYGKVYLPSGDIKGYFQVVHGKAEHIGRYDELLRAVASNGYLAFAFDNLGHGFTARDKSELGFIAHKNGWKLLVEDVKTFYKEVFEEYGEMPYYLFGHSLGSFIVRIANNNVVYPDKIIAMGTGDKSRLGWLGGCLARTLKIFKGDKHVSKFMDKLAFSSYNKPFKSEGSHRSWLTSDPSVRECYDKDEYRNFRFGLSALQDVIVLNKKANSKKAYESFNGKSLLLVSGRYDAVSKFTKDMFKIFKRYEKAGAKVEMRLYDGRHEILNEPSIKDKVIQDILTFIEK